MININLIPLSVQIEHRRSKHMKRWIVACLGAALLFTLTWCYDWFSQMKIESLSKENQITMMMLQEEQLKLQELSQSVHDAELKVQRATTLRQKRSWSGLITLIATALPPRSWIVSIATIPEIPPASMRRVARTVSQSPNNAETNPVMIDAPRKLKLIGYAVDAAEPMLFMANLKVFSVFTKVSLQRSYLEPVEDDKYYRFELVCEW